MINIDFHLQRLPQILKTTVSWKKKYPVWLKSKIFLRNRFLCFLFFVFDFCFEVKDLSSCLLRFLMDKL